MAREIQTLRVRFRRRHSLRFNRRRRVGYFIALAMVKPELADIGQIFEIDILGQKFKAEIIEESPFDPNNECLRA